MTSTPFDSLRIGQGFDVHPFAPVGSDRVLVLGGVRFESGPALVGHSDADVIAHACIDALLGAAGLGDIGGLFPDTDPAYGGADSIALLALGVARVHDAGWRVINIDCTVIVDEPKIAPHRAEMEQRLSATVEAPVAVKGKRTEGVAGLGGGIQCHAVALLTRFDQENLDQGNSEIAGQVEEGRSR